MCYLVAKKFKKQGSIALEIQHGKELSDLSRSLTLQTLKNNVQIVTISNPEAYKEYAPYTIIKDKEEFQKQVLAL